MIIFIDLMRNDSPCVLIFMQMIGAAGAAIDAVFEK